VVSSLVMGSAKPLVRLRYSVLCTVVKKNISRARKGKKCDMYIKSYKKKKSTTSTPDVFSTLDALPKFVRIVNYIDNLRNLHEAVSAQWLLVTYILFYIIRA
jgi:hypothetical protein